MPIGPHGEKRSPHPVAAALEVMRVAIGESDEKPARSFTVLYDEGPDPEDMTPTSCPPDEDDDDE